MKRLSFFLVSVLFAVNIFADDHYTTAVDLVNAAVKEGSSGNASNLVRFATRALEKTKADAATAPSDIKLLLNNAAVELQKAIEHGCNIAENVLDDMEPNVKDNEQNS